MERFSDYGYFTILALAVEEATLKRNLLLHTKIGAWKVVVNDDGEKGLRLSRPPGVNARACEVFLAMPGVIRIILRNKQRKVLQEKYIMEDQARGLNDPLVYLARLLCRELVNYLRDNPSE